MDGFSLHAKPDGTTHLLFTGLELLRRLCSRRQTAAISGPQAGEEETSVAPQAAASKEPMKEGTPRGDWADLLSRTFDFEVCGSTRLPHCSGGPCQRCSSAPLLQPSPATWPLSLLYAKTNSVVS